MKTVSRRICGVVLGLSVLGLIGPVVRADEMADWLAEMQRQNEECRRKAQEDREAQDRANQQAQAEREARDRAYQEAQAEQAARDRAYQEAQAAREAQDRWDEQQRQWREAQDKAYAEQEARDRAYREAEQARAETAAWHQWQEEERQRWENKQRWQEWEEWMGLGSADWSAAATDSTPGQVPVARPTGLVILNPFALKQMAPEEQEKVRQQATLGGQPIMQESQLIQNPFVVAPQ